MSQEHCSSIVKSHDKNKDSCVNLGQVLYDPGGVINVSFGLHLSLPFLPSCLRNSAFFHNRSWTRSTVHSLSNSSLSPLHIARANTPSSFLQSALLSSDEGAEGGGVGIGVGSGRGGDNQALSITFLPRITRAAAA